MTAALTACLVVFSMLSGFSAYAASGFSAGAAPKGDPQTVAARIIKYNFPQCKPVTNAPAGLTGTIRASCDGVSYYVFTMYLPSEGKMLKLAINCKESKHPRGVHPRKILKVLWPRSGLTIAACPIIIRDAWSLECCST